MGESKPEHPQEAVGWHVGTGMHSKKPLQDARALKVIKDKEKLLFRKRRSP
jgi:hypothetical protein